MGSNSLSKYSYNNRQQVLVSPTNNIKIFLTQTTVFRTKRIIDYETQAYNPMHRTQS